MKKILIASCFLLIAPITCSERNWLRSRIDTFAKQLTTRHTYEYNSWEHTRDKALLYLLPANVSQMVLTNQRFNMIKFLKQNEEDALENVFKYWNIDKPTIVKIKNDIKKAHEFNLEEMKKPHNVFHDQSLPAEWIKAINYGCKKHQIDPKSINLLVTSSPDNPNFAASYAIAPSWGIFWNNYNPPKITLNVSRYTGNIPALRHAAIHELTHIKQGHCLQTYIIVKNAPDLSQKKLVKYVESSTYQNIFAAEEKTADTLIACLDPEAAKDAASYITINGYEQNNNDMLIIHSNWQTSQAIINYQQLKNSITQKLNVFPKSFA
jgi:hypothetical protein